MNAVHLVLAGLLASTGAPVQEQQPSRPPQGSAGTQAPAACTADVARLCAARSLKQECLVQHWTRISSGCQDSLSKPMQRGSD